MDPKYCLQDVVRCYLCETGIPRGYCETCNIRLCVSCVEKHLSDESTEHILVVPERGSPKCKYHPYKLCKFYCEKCDFHFCSDCMGLVDHIELKKENIKWELAEISSRIDSKHRSRLIDENSLICILNEHSDKIRTILGNLQDEWYDEIYRIIRKLKTEVRDLNSHHFLRRNETTSREPYFTNIVNSLEHIKHLKMHHYCEVKSEKSYFQSLPSKFNLRQTLRMTLNTNNGRPQELPISTDKIINAIKFEENDPAVSDNASTEFIHTKSRLETSV